jgi:alpha-L-fucosidase 2
MGASLCPVGTSSDSFMAFATPTSRNEEPTLWYKQPAPDWSQALPLGNGKLGAMVFGGVSA